MSRFRVAKGRRRSRIVGPSGAGKSTLVDLLPRFHEPIAGAICLDGVPLDTLQRQSLRALIGVVSQDTVLLNDTVHANISFGVPDRHPGRRWRRPRAPPTPRSSSPAFPQGYDTVLGERGTRLSGGQRQRIASPGRCCATRRSSSSTRPPAPWTPESERLVQEAIDRLMQDRTVLVIAHRLATVRHADQILVLEDGRVVEHGTHEALIEHDGLYRRLHDLQFRDEGPAGALVTADEEEEGQ